MYVICMHICVHFIACFYSHLCLYLLEHEDAVRSVCPDLNVQAALTNLEGEIVKSEETLELFDQGDKVFKKFKEKLKTNHKCPLCEQEMGDRLQWLIEKVSYCLCWEDWPVP